MYANGVSFRGRVEVRDCAKLVKVVIKKFDDRNGERIMHTEILHGFLIKSLPTDVPVGQLLKKKKEKMEKFRNFLLDIHGTVGSTFNML